MKAVYVHVDFEEGIPLIPVYGTEVLHLDQDMKHYWLNLLTLHQDQVSPVIVLLLLSLMMR